MALTVEVKGKELIKANQLLSLGGECPSYTSLTSHIWGRSLVGETTHPWVEGPDKLE